MAVSHAGQGSFIGSQLTCEHLKENLSGSRSRTSL